MYRPLSRDRQHGKSDGLRVPSCCCSFSDANISEGSAAMRLRNGGIFYHFLIGLVEEFQTSSSILQSPLEH